MAGVPMSLADKVKEYNAYYCADPDAWDDLHRDAFAFSILDDLYEIDEEPPGSLLDIGCGNGHTIAYFQERWPDVAYTGLDLSQVAIGQVQLRAIKGLFLAGALEEVPLGPFDLVLLMGVAEHFEDLGAGLIAARKTMDPNGGVMYLEVPNCLAYPHSEQEEGFRRVNFGRRQEEWHLKRETWERIIQDAGLRILKAIQGPSMTYEFIWIVGKA